jgi:hypothetical protein
MVLSDDCDPSQRFSSAATALRSFAARLPTRRIAGAASNVASRERRITRGAGSPARCQSPMTTSSRRTSRMPRTVVTIAAKLASRAA